MFGGEICIHTYPSDEYSQAIGRLKQSWKTFTGLVPDKPFYGNCPTNAQKKKNCIARRIWKKKSKAVLLKESGKINHT